MYRHEIKKKTFIKLLTTAVFGVRLQGTVTFQELV